MARNAKNFFKIEMLLLKIINDGECYGYQIVQSLDKMTDGYLHIAEGTMYPILYKLLDQGYISDEKKLVGKRQTRIYYRIEKKGQIYLQELYKEYKTMTKYIENIMEDFHE